MSAIRFFRVAALAFAPSRGIALLLGVLLCLVLTGPANAEPVLDAASKTWLDAHGPIKLAPDPDFAPIDFIDSSGRHRGVSADLLALLARRAGLRAEIVRKPNFDAVIEALLRGEIEAASSVYRSPDREQKMLFSNPYLRLPAALIARRDGLAITQLSDLRGRRIAVVRGHVWQELLKDAGYLAEQQPAPNVAAALDAVLNGKADAYVGDVLSADRAMRKGNLADALMITGESGLEAQIAFAIRADLPELKRVLDQALQSITFDEEVALRARWEGAAALSDDAVEDAVPASRATQLAELRTLVAARQTLPDAERAALLARIDQALVWETEADQSRVRVDRVAQSAEQARADVQALQVALASGSAEELLRWRGSLPQRATLQQLEQLLLAEQTARSGLQDLLGRLSQQAQELQQRPASLRNEIAELSAQLGELVIAEDSSELNARVEREANLAQARVLRAKLAAALAEQSNLETLLQGADARKRERQRALAARVERVTTLEQLIAERSASEFTQELSGLRDTATRYAEALPAIRDLANENLATGMALAARTKRLSEWRDQAQAIDNSATAVATALTNARERIDLGGVTEAVGVLLQAERRRLPRPALLSAQLATLQRESADLQLAQIALLDEIDALSDLAASVARLSGSDADHPSGFTPEQRTALTELLLARSELLPRLSQLQQKTVEVLKSTEQRLSQLLADAQVLTQLMERHLLWIPSHRPIAMDWWSRWWEDTRDMFKAERWLSSGQKLVERLAQKPFWILGLVLPFALILLRGRLLSKLTQTAALVRDVRKDRLRYTVQAIAVSALLAAPMALLWWLLGHMLQAVGEGGRFTHSAGSALQLVAPYLYVFTLLGVICRDDGVAQMHLRWLRIRREALLALRPYLYFVVTPLLFMAALTLARNLDSANATVLRAVVIVLPLVLAALLFWLLAKERLFVSRVAGPDPQPGMRRALRAILSVGLLATAGIAVLGYVFTAAVLLLAFMDTLQVLMILTLAHGVVLRWLVIGERRVALAQQQLQSEAEPESAGVDVPVVSIDSVNLRTISTQSRSLLRAFTVVSVAAGLLWSLSDVAPAFSLLDQVVLWQSTTKVDGVSQVSQISLGDALLALAALLVGVIAARNIPGLLEILLLKRFTEDASVRYAAVAVTRYLISFLMVVAVFGLLGVRWGDLQWLAAGFSVGLGFGLQEIFGNFVAGLILLFERPFRVGDVVTIGELTGTVRRVHTRATTIVDFDKKDIVIPNKTFITERFVNWTLTDTVTRIVLKIGVSYQSDPDEVRATLLQLAHAHPGVLEDPAPVALFMALADSSLSFELRCFVRDIGDRLRTSDDLHGRIINSFRARGIVLAYPQLDVHLRPQEAPAAPSSAPGARPTTANGGHEVLEPQ